jgi:hypothetical protein
VEEDGRPSAPGDESGPTDWAGRSGDEPIGWDQRVEPVPRIPRGEPAAAADPAPPTFTLSALADPATRSPRPDTCPFLRTIDAFGAPAPPVEAVDPANRCVAVGAPTPQSARQQQLVCLSSGHSNCPRYLRGSAVATEALVPAKERGPSTPVVAAALTLVAAAAMSVGFLLVRGGFDLPAGAAGGSQLAAATLPIPSGAGPSQPPIATPDRTGASTPVPTHTPESTPSPTAPAPSPTPIATPAPPTTAPPTLAPPTPGSTSNRYALLVPCPNTADCWIYTVRAGDNFQSIVNYFGVPYDTVIRMNPGLGDPANIHAGDRIRMPPPTR